MKKLYKEQRKGITQMVFTFISPPFKNFVPTFVIFKIHELNAISAACGSLVIFRRIVVGSDDYRFAVQFIKQNLRVGVKASVCVKVSHRRQIVFF